MRKLIFGALAFLTLCAGPAEAQAPPFPQTLPANTVVGRLGISPGPAQAIPLFSRSNIFTGNNTLTGTTTFTGQIKIGTNTLSILWSPSASNAGLNLGDGTTVFRETVTGRLQLSSQNGVVECVSPCQFAINTGTPIAGAGLTLSSASFNQTITNPTMATSIYTFLSSGDSPTTNPTAFSVSATKTSAGVQLDPTFIVQTLVNGTGGGVGSIVGGVKVLQDGIADAYGLLGIINLGPAITTPSGQAFFALIRGDVGGNLATGNLTAVKATSEIATATFSNPRSGFQVENSTANNAFIYGLWVTSATTTGVLVAPGSADARFVQPTYAFAYQTVAGGQVWEVDTNGSTKTISLRLSGSTSGTLTLLAPAVAGSNSLRFPAGTTDFTATGGTSQVVKQTSVGGAFTVARLACADLSNSNAGCSNDWFDQSVKTTASPTFSAPTVTTLNVIAGGTIDLTNATTIKRNNSTGSMDFTDQINLFNFAGAIVVTTYVQTGAVAVGSLPSCAAGTKGARHFVTDSNAVSFTAGIGAVVAAGGSTNVPVVCDGTNWRIGANDNQPQDRIAA